MYFYFIVFIVLALLLVASSLSYSYSRLVYFMFFLLIFCITGFRGDVGQDTLSYGVIYAEMAGLDSLKLMLLRQEPFLNVIMYIHKLIFDSYTGFLVLVASLQMLLLAYATRSLAHRRLFLFFYLLVFWLDNNLNILRAGFSVLFFMAALSDMSTANRRVWFWAALSVLSHVSAIIAFPVLFFRAKLSLKVFVFSSFASLLLASFLFWFFGEMISVKLSAYDLMDFTGFGLSYPLLGLFLMIATCLVLTKDKSVALVYSSCLLLVSFSLSSFTDIAYRFIYISALVFMFLVFEVRGAWIGSGRVVLRPMLVGTVVLMSWLSYTQVVYMMREPHQRLATGKGNYEFSYVPYMLFYDSKYR